MLIPLSRESVLAARHRFMTLRSRILMLVVGFVAMTVVVMLFGLSTIADYNGMITDYDRAAENAYRGERLNYLISSAVMESRGIYNARTHEDIDLFAGRLDRDLDRIEAELVQWRRDGIASRSVDLGNIEVKTAAFVAVRRGLAQVARTQSAAAAEEIGRQTRQSRMTFQADIERIVADTRGDMLATKARAEIYRRERAFTFVAVTLLWIVVTAGLGMWVVSHFITRELNRSREAEISREKLLKELMESNTELERFAYVASHDMQEPVRMVNIYSQMVVEDYENTLDERGRKYLRTISASAGRMQVMIQDLLSYSRLRNDPADMVAVDLNHRLKHVRASFARLVEETGAQIEGEGLPTVYANPVQIQRLLENLISNGIKYQLLGQVAVIQVTAADDGDRWRITVADNGIGIDPEFASGIFEPFRRLHSWEEYPGTGLGLSICRKIVERHGGRIWVESLAGDGTRFHFTLAKPPVVPFEEPVEAVSAA